MTFKENIKKELQDKTISSKLRYESSKLALIVVILLFFTSIFLYWAWLYPDFFSSAVSILYFLLIISFGIFFYFIFCNKFTKKKLYIFTTIIILVSITLLIPLFVRF